MGLQSLSRETDGQKHTNLNIQNLISDFILEISDFGKVRTDTCIIPGLQIDHILNILSFGIPEEK